jgi:hypothetical protein
MPPPCNPRSKKLGGPQSQTGRCGGYKDVWPLREPNQPEIAQPITQSLLWQAYPGSELLIVLTIYIYMGIVKMDLTSRIKVDWINLVQDTDQ